MTTLSLRRQRPPVPAALRSNFKHLYWDIAWFGVLSGSAIAFLTVYAARLGGDVFQIGLITAGPAVVNLVTTLPSGRWLETRPIGPAVFWSAAFHRLFYLLWIIIPWLLLPKTEIWAYILVTLVMSIPGTVLAVGFNALFADAVPAEWRPHVTGVRNAVLSVAFIITSLASGLILEALPFPLGYQVVFAIGALGALMQRGITGLGQEVQSALFENNVFLVGQHMMQYAVTGKPAAPMPERISAWAVYDVFTVKDGEQIFLAAVSDAQWATFCDALGFADLKADARYGTNNQRVTLRPELMPILRERLAHHSAAGLAALFERVGLPFAPIRKPEELFDDEHLNATGGLADITLPDGARAGQTARTTLFPFTMDGQRLGVRLQPPHQGEHTTELLAALGYDDAAIEALRVARAVA